MSQARPRQREGRRTSPALQETPARSQTRKGTGGRLHACRCRLQRCRCRSTARRPVWPGPARSNSQVKARRPPPSRGSSPPRRETACSVRPGGIFKALVATKPLSPRPSFTLHGQSAARSADQSVPSRNLLWVCRRSPEHAQRKRREAGRRLRHRRLGASQGACPDVRAEPDPSGHSPVSRCGMTDGRMKSRAPRLSGDGRLMMTRP